MSDDKPTLFEERKLERDAYKKGVREGWDQAFWLIFAIVVIIIVVDLNS